MNEMSKPESVRVSPFRDRYDNFIGGKFVAPVDGAYFDNVTPINGQTVCQVARSGPADVELALDAAHAAKAQWGATSATERATIILKIADRLEENLDLLARAETWDNGKPIRETTAADIPLAIDHFRYFAGVLRAQEGTMSQIDADTVAYHYHEPLGVVGQIIPWNFSILMAAWKLAPALAAGNCIVLKPAEQTPAAILVLAELIADLLPDGVLNVVNGYGAEVGGALAESPRIAKIAFTGSTETGRKIMQAATKNLIPVTLELGGKSPNVFFSDIMAEDDAFLDKAVEGFVLFAFNQGEVCTCPSRALIQEDIYEDFIERCIARVKAIKQGDPRDMKTMVGAQASEEQRDKIMSYFTIGVEEGAEVLTGGGMAAVSDDIAGGFYIQPTILKGHNKMRVFQEEIFGPVVSVTTFKDEAEALALANDTMYGLGAGVWSRDANRCYRMGRGIEAGRVWVNNYHAYPAHAAFGGYKQSGIGRENHKMMLDHYQQGEEKMSKTMKAAVVREFGAPLRIEEVPVPEVEPGMIQVAIQASGVCHTDLHAAEGDWPVKPKPPFIPGHEGVGFVSAVGKGVTHVKEGDRVGVPWLYTACGHCRHCLGGWETLCESQQNTGYSVNGGFADYVLADPNYIGHLPDNIGFNEIAPVLCAGVTVYKGLKMTDARPGDTIAISGIGGLGHMAVQYAAAMGFDVVAVDIDDAKLDLARRLGAKITVNARTSEDPAAEVKRETGGGVQGILVTAVS